MTNLRTLTLGLAAAAIFVATPAFAQKGTGGPTPVVEAEKPARTAVQIDYQCAYDQPCATAYQVPAGMRFVAESLMAHVTQPGAAPAAIVSVAAELDGIAQQELAFIHGGQYVYSTTVTRFFNYAIRFYSDSAPAVSLGFAGMGAIHIVGHLERK